MKEYYGNIDHVVLLAPSKKVEEIYIQRSESIEAYGGFLGWRRGPKKDGNIKRLMIG